MEQIVLETTTNEGTLVTSGYVQEVKQKEHKPVYHFVMSGITNAEGSENFTVQFNAHDGETEEEVLTKIDKAKRLFDHVWKSNNKRALAVADHIKKLKVEELPKQFN